MYKNVILLVEMRRSYDRLISTMVVSYAAKMTSLYWIKVQFDAPNGE